LLAAGGAERLGGLDALLSLALEHLKLLALVERALQLLLGGTQRGQHEAERVHTLLVALLHRLGEVFLDLGDQRHSKPSSPVPPRTCQCKWKTVWPPPAPTFTTTR